MQHTTAPANPPAIRANPKKSTSLAFHATLVPEYVKLSALRRDFSIELMTSMPSAEQMPGIQSTNLMCTSEPFLGECEYVAASMKKKRPRENLIDERGQYGGWLFLRGLLVGMGGERGHGEEVNSRCRRPCRRLLSVSWSCSATAGARSAIACRCSTS